MKILVLGHNGMLGRTATNYYSSNNEVFTTNEIFSMSNRHTVLQIIKKIKPDVIINAVGKIKQKNPNDYDLFFVNSYLPKFISENLSKDQILVQPSTDCVFSGIDNKKGYSLSSTPDPTDNYGLSKLLSEDISKNSNCLVVRTSIIGIEKNTSYGLLSWFINSNSAVDGYENHIWSGITALEWCKCVEKLISSNHSGLCHIASSSISKFELLQICKEVFSINSLVNKKQHEVSLNRSLIESIIKVKEIEEQLIELRDFYFHS